ncbi:SPRY domain-containing SOCS box protein 3 isoform X3 [Sphaerodactylus townsendi]|uniref:SPRY domain-containing SOCS box protein 3 isoform X3 n=1 Tax=Sphaerodactylus townsendi TaxID=933632 RepID=UPI002026E032|nr:SPRY domain-containing SOCS box protein 3 isoform X3 [Sphaerodactylus townsendi]
MPGGFSPTCLCMWGLLHHKGDRVNFSTRFGQGSIIGVHLDTWHGTLTFFKNRKCIGSRFLRRVVRAEAGERRRQGAGPESTGGAWWLCCGRGRRAGSSMVGESRMFLWNRGQQPLPPKEPFGPVFHSPKIYRGGRRLPPVCPSLTFPGGDTQFGPSDLQATGDH